MFEINFLYCHPSWNHIFYYSVFINEYYSVFGIHKIFGIPIFFVDKNTIWYFVFRYLSLMKILLKIFSVLLIIFTIIYFTCFGCLLVLNNSSSLVAQTVTLSSEGGANETYPDSMGEYQLAGEIRKFRAVYNWYQHMDREDRFLIYNNQGNSKD